MALNEETEQLNLCEERFHKSKTSFIIPIDINNICNNTTYNNVKVPFSKKIRLTQEPYEILTLTLNIKKIGNSTSYSTNCGYCGRGTSSLYLLDLNLNFDNNSHEICQSYVYAIKLNILKQ